MPQPTIRSLTPVTFARFQDTSVHKLIHFRIKTIYIHFFITQHSILIVIITVHQTGLYSMSDNQILATTSHSNTQKTELNEGAVINELGIPESTDSVWYQSKFPSNTNVMSFSPQKLKSTIIEYSEVIDKLIDVLSRNGVSKDSFYRLSGQYPEIKEFYLAARRHKAEVFGGEMIDLWKDLPAEEELYVYDRDGNKSLSTAASSYLKCKSDNMYRISQILESGSYIPISKQETTNRNLNFGVQLNGKLPDNFDLANSTPELLIDAIRGKKPV